MLSFYRQKTPLQKVPSQPKNDAYIKKEGTLIIRRHFLSFTATLTIAKIILGAHFQLVNL